MFRRLELRRECVLVLVRRLSESELWKELLCCAAPCAANSDGEGREAVFGDDGTIIGGWGRGEVGRFCAFDSSYIAISSIVSSSELPGSSSSELISSSESMSDGEWWEAFETGSSNAGSISSLSSSIASPSRFSPDPMAITRANSSNECKPPCKRPSAS